jgi:hypothetical protein
MDDAGIPALIDAIRHLHGCEAKHVETVKVREVHEGAVIWDGEVEVFDLVGHPKSKRAYAWSHATTGEKRRFVAVLHAEPVNSPLAAVRASIVAEVKAGQN